MPSKRVSQAWAGSFGVDLVTTGQVFTDIAMLEGVGGMSRLLEQTPVERVLFGSHHPLFYYESSVLKLRESALGEIQLKAVTSENARRLVSRPDDSRGRD